VTVTVTVTAKKTITLPNLLPITFYLHFLDGSGTTVCLSPQQFGTLANTGRARGRTALSNGQYAQETSYYGTPYANTFGTAELVLQNSGGGAVGFYDTYDFDMRPRSVGAEVMTGIGASGYLLIGKNFDIGYNHGDC
jgi:hypothetical protein